MFYLYSFTFLGIILFVFCFAGASGRKTALPQGFVPALFLSALILRLLAASLSEGFGTDTACFAAWADRIFQTGPSGFYSPDVFTDYPPGYMYILWLAGTVRNLFSIEYYSSFHLILLKLPSIFCDLACGWLLFREAIGKTGKKTAFFLCLAYLFNPAVILNSSVWGQVDSVLTLAVVCMCLCLVHKKLSGAYAAFCIGILIKPQMLMFSPVLLAGILDQVFLRHFSFRNLFRQFLAGSASVAGAVVLCLPFGLENIWNQYFSTLSSYPYAAVNACNLWGLFGLNWISQDNAFLGIPYRVYGGAAIAAAVILMLLYSFRLQKESEKYTLLAALLILTVYAFSVRMHERYMYPGLLLLLFAYVYRPAKLIFLLYGAYSSLHFLNTGDVLFFYDPASYDRSAPLTLAVSGGIVLCTLLLYHALFRSVPDGSVSKNSAGGAVPEGPAWRKEGIAPRAARKKLPLRPADILCMLAITIVYGCFALYDLGDRNAPSTSLDMLQGQTIELDFGDESPAVLWYYIAPWQKRTFLMEGQRAHSEEWLALGEATLNNVFTWQSITLEPDMSRLRFTLDETRASLLEWVFLDSSGRIVAPSNASSYEALFDESSLYPKNGPLLTAMCRLINLAGGEIQLCPKAGSFRDSMYFDEIYHGRTAYEFIHGLTSYENTHPPLGKIFIALGILVFGMNPFGWRFAGALFGIAMVPLVYLFARKLCGRTSLAALACLLFAFDFMHFAQTRIATIDVFITFFVLLMYFFMYQYSTISFYDSPLKKTFIPLGACGITMGLGIASKWTGIYAGAGLALIFFSVMTRRYLEYVYAKNDPLGSTEGISHRHIVQSFAVCTRRTIGFCMVFFVLVPALIYLLSYLPFRDYADRGLIERTLANQNTMFSYHSTLNATHDFSSPWYQWPVIKRPIWFYSHIVTKTAGGGLREGISSFGNPLVWWAGIPAALYMVYLWAAQKNRTAAFLTIGYLAQYLPWFFVTRITFIYHYFPSVVFVVLMIVYSFAQWRKACGKKVYYTSIVLYGTAVFGLFLLFYPVLSGQPTEVSYVEKYLRWFQSWVLAAR